MSGPTPVTILTGAPGSGKSTLANRLLAAPGFADTAVVVAEAGEVAIDHPLARVAAGVSVFVPAACLCCRAAGGVAAALRELHFERAAHSVPAFHRAIVEAAGDADPAHLAALFAELPLVAARYTLAGIVAVVDARRGAAALEREPRWVRQLERADRLVVTKSSDASPASLAGLHACLAAINPRARILDTARGGPDPREFFAIHRPETAGA